MIVLDSTSKVLRARLGGAVAANQPTFAFAWGDDGGDLGSTEGALNSTTNVTLVDSPASGVQRAIRSGFIYNKDTAAVTVIIEHYDGTTAHQIAKITLDIAETLVLGADGFSGGTAGDITSSPYDWIIALGDETTAITTGTAKVTVRAPRAMTLTKIKASLSTAGSGSSAFDVNKNGTSVFSTALTIDATEKTSETAATPAVLSTTSIAADDELTFDIDTAGSSAAGAKITLVAAA